MNTYTQTAYNGIRRGVPGAAVDGTLCEKLTASALEILKPGRFGVMQFSVDEDRADVRYARANVMNIVFAADIAADNFQGTLSLTAFDGTVTTTAINTAFNATHNGTITDILADFNAVAGITATSNDTGDNRTVTLTAAAGVQLGESIPFSMSGGAPVVTVGYDTTDVINCIIGHDPTTEQTEDGETRYRAKEDAPVFRVGAVWMDAETAMAPGSLIAARLVESTGTNQKLGSLSNTVGSPQTGTLVANASLYKPTSSANATSAVEVNFKGRG